MKTKTKQIIAIIAVIIAIPVAIFAVKHYFFKNQSEADFLKTLNESSLSLDEKEEMLKDYVKKNQRSEKQQKKIDDERQKDEKENPPGVGQISNWQKAMSNQELDLDMLLDPSVTEKEIIFEKFMLELKNEESLLKSIPDFIKELKDSKLSNTDMSLLLKSYIEKNIRTKEKQQELNDERKKDEKENPVGIGQAPNWQKGMSNEEYIIDVLLDPALTEEQRDKLIDKFLLS